MFGQTETIQILVFTTAGIAALSDFWTGRIYNFLTVPALITGLISASYWLGWIGFAQGLAGALMGLALLGWMFCLGHIGGGDVKLLMAFGAMGGPRFALSVAILSVLLGGVFALVSLSFRGRLRSLILKIRVFIYTLMTAGMPVQMPEMDRKLTIPFGIPMAIAAVIVLLWNPLQGLILNAFPDQSSFLSMIFTGATTGSRLWP